MYQAPDAVFPDRTRQKLPPFLWAIIWFLDHRTIFTGSRQSALEGPTIETFPSSEPCNRNFIPSKAISSLRSYDKAVW